MNPRRRAPAPVHPLTSAVRTVDRIVWGGVAVLSVATLLGMLAAPILVLVVEVVL